MAHRVMRERPPPEARTAAAVASSQAPRAQPGSGAFQDGARPRGSEAKARGHREVRLIGSGAKESAGAPTEMRIIGVEHIFPHCKLVDM